MIQSLPSNRGRGAGGRGRPRGRGKRGNANSGGAPSRGRGRGRGRGRPTLKTFQSSRNQSSKSPSDGKSRESGESSGQDDNDYNQTPGFPEIAPFSSEGLDPPKLPKLKLGALIISKETPKLSPKLHRSKSGKSSKHHRKSSVDSKDGEKVKVPKLTIRLGPKPDSKPSKSEKNPSDKPSEFDIQDETNVQEKLVKSKPSDFTSEIDGICATKEDDHKKSDDSSTKVSNISTSAKAMGDTIGDKSRPGADDSKQVENPYSLSFDDEKDSTGRKGQAKFDNINDKSSTGLPNIKQSPKVALTSNKSSKSELDTIFGPPGVPLDISSVATNQTTSSSSASYNDLSTKCNLKEDDQEKSELDLIREELMKDKLDARTPPQASPHADTALGPLRKAINAARNSSSAKASSISGSAIASSNIVKNDHTHPNQSSTSSEINTVASTQMATSQSDSTTSTYTNHVIDDGNLAATNDSHMMKMKFKDLKMKFRHAEFKSDPRKSPLSSSVHHPIPSTLSMSDTSHREGGSSLSTNTAAMGNANNSSLNNPAVGDQPRSSGGGYAPKGYNRKKALLNTYFERDIYPATVNGPSSTLQPPQIGSQGQTNMSGQSSSMLPTPSGSSQQQYQRPVSFKMPKAVASVISVPTRADYQTQLDSALERKRKRENGDSGGNGKGDGGDGKGGRKKKGRGKQADEDPDFKASHLKAGDKSKGGNSAEGGKDVKKPKTRGKPPKKCLAESPPHEEDRVGDMKADAMNFAAAIRAEFDQHTSTGSSNSSSTGRSLKGGSITQSPLNASSNSNPSAQSSQSSKPKVSSLRDVRIPKDKNKRKRGEKDESSPVVSKTPKIVIKFAKDTKGPSSSNVASCKGATSMSNSNTNIGPVSESKEEDSNKNGIDVSSPFDFVENECAEAFRHTAAQVLPMVDGTVDGSAYSSMNNSPATPGTPISAEGNPTHNKLPKIKIKVPTA